MRLHAVGIALALAIVLVPAVVATPAKAQDKTFTVLYSFTGGADGGYPYGGLIRDAAGDLYGTTYGGGSSKCSQGCGVVFMVDKAGNETVLYSFTGTGGDGGNPFAGLVRDAAGNLYGTTFHGGASGAGTVFNLDNTGKETVLYSFTGLPDGEGPHAGLLRDAAGNLYGTTEEGGSGACSFGGFDYGCGTVFMLDTAGKETVLYSFSGTGGDGAVPYAGLVRDAAGNLYGTTSGGGASSEGTVFKLDTTGKETVLHSFTGTGRDGTYPYAPLIRDSKGNLYGTTYGGGASGAGMVFKLDSAGKETVLYSFTGTGGDGAGPMVGLVQDAKGNLYGTTRYGGSFHGVCYQSGGCGVVFMLDKGGKETVLHKFAGSDGLQPLAGLVRDAKGNFYGTTSEGGASGFGTVFELTP
jgi:uncharacterized repeat protein (TIGR03803 family)